MDYRQFPGITRLIGGETRLLNFGLSVISYVRSLQKKCEICMSIASRYFLASVSCVKLNLSRGRHMVPWGDGACQTGTDSLVGHWRVAGYRAGNKVINFKFCSYVSKGPRDYSIAGTEFTELINVYPQLCQVLQMLNV